MKLKLWNEINKSFVIYKYQYTRFNNMLYDFIQVFFNNVIFFMSRKCVETRIFVIMFLVFYFQNSNVESFHVNNCCFKKTIAFNNDVFSLCYIFVFFSRKTISIAYNESFLEKIKLKSNTKRRLITTYSLILTMICT